MGNIFRWKSISLLNSDLLAMILMFSLIPKLLLWTNFGLPLSVGLFNLLNILAHLKFGLLWFLTLFNSIALERDLPCLQLLLPWTVFLKACTLQTCHFIAYLRLNHFASCVPFSSVLSCLILCWLYVSVTSLSIFGILLFIVVPKEQLAVGSLCLARYRVAGISLLVKSICCIWPFDTIFERIRIGSVGQMCILVLLLT